MELFRWDVDGTGRRTFQHGLAAHPALAAERLVEFAERADRNGGVKGGGLVVDHLEQEPGLADLIAACDREIRATFPGLAGASIRARLVVSPPAHSEPFAIVPQSGFVAQLHGRREISVVAREPGSGRAYDLERYYSGRDGAAGRAEQGTLVFTLFGGGGFHRAPHSLFGWTVQGDEPSVAVHLDFSTRQADREAEVHRVNALLRRLGVNARPVGQSLAFDELKAAAGTAQLRVAELLHRLRSRVKGPPPT